MIRSILVLAGLTLATPVFAVGSGSSSEPTTTETTTECTDGQVYDADSQSCVDAESRLLDDDERYEAVRELAYAGQLGAAQNVLAAMSDQSSDRVLTYWGFTHRKMGRPDLGMAYYRKAITANPDNLIARSYMGQHLVETGDMVGARRELIEIASRGGEGGWPETALRRAIETGAGTGY